MKKLLFILMLLSATNVFAQDVIVKKDGSTILSKVFEVGTSEVKYKKFSNQNGPTYSISKSDVQAINYENGEKESFNNSATTVQDYNSSNYNYTQVDLTQNNRYQKEQLLISAKHWRNTGSTLGIIISLVGVGIGIGIAAGDDWNMTPCYIGVGSGLGLGAFTALICGEVANKKEEEASAIASLPLFKQDFEIGSSHLSAGVNIMNERNSNTRTLGVGLCWSF